MANVALVGIGKLGLRHLEGMGKSKTPLNISLVDPSKAAIERAKKQWVESYRLNIGHTLHDTVPSRCDLAIIATTADFRRRAVEGLAEYATVNAWIVEKPIGQSITDIDAVVHIAKNRAWVNTPRRAMPWHKEIAAVVRSLDRPLHVVVKGGRWGLACNALHFIDLVRWWSGSEPHTVDVSGLDRHWHESKRPGYSEIYGMLRIIYADGGSLDLVSAPNEEPHLIRVQTPTSECYIDERAGKFYDPNGQVSTGRMIYQSSLTGATVDNILSGNSPSLPKILEIAETERLLLRALIPHFHADGGSIDRLNIT